MAASRRHLAGPADVRHVELGMCSGGESTALLRVMVDDGRADDDPDAADSVSALCGHLPLAMRTAASCAASRSNWSVRRGWNPRRVRWRPSR
ncbi:hypothetical protein E6R18_01670 [Streptomyces sp. A1277]|nr:hypothetical protein E6R18_01670 [Streptomyces sp. A1277]